MYVYVCACEQVGLVYAMYQTEWGDFLSGF